jgi:uncharacterized delta-60 repeat protein
VNKHVPRVLTAALLMTTLTVSVLAQPAAAAALDTALDATFAANLGGGFNNAVFAAERSPGGKITVTGLFTAVHGVTSNRVARLNSDGTLDTAFTTNLGAGFNNDVYAAAIQADGRAVVGGTFSTFGGVASAFIARINADGTRDPSFTASLGSGLNGRVVRIVQQADGKLLIGGNFTSVNGVASSHLARLNTDGTLDATFSAHLGTGLNNEVHSIAVQSDGKIVVGGFFTSVGAVASHYLGRLAADGTPDATFNANVGSRIVGTVVQTITLQPGGGIVIGGTFQLTGRLSLTSPR